MDDIITFNDSYDTVMTVTDNKSLPISIWGNWILKPQKIHKILYYS